MKLIGIKSFSGLVKLILDVLFFLVIIFVLLSPKLVSMFVSARFFLITPYLEKAMFGIFVCSGITVIFVLYELRKIFKSINNKTPFSETNVKSLFRMGLASFALAIFFIFKLFVLQSLLTYIVIFILIIAGCFSWVLSEVFKEALRVKEENDLTI